MKRTKPPLWCSYYAPTTVFEAKGYRPEWRCRGTVRRIHGYVSVPFLPQIWVCGTCYKPSYHYFRNRLHTCYECGTLFDAPGEEVCKDCSPNRPYRGWRWLTQEMLKTKCLTLALALVILCLHLPEQDRKFRL